MFNGLLNYYFSSHCEGNGLTAVLFPVAFITTGDTDVETASLSPSHAAEARGRRGKYSNIRPPWM